MEIHFPLKNPLFCKVTHHSERIKSFFLLFQKGCTLYSKRRKMNEILFWKLFLPRNFPSKNFDVGNGKRDKMKNLK